ncbi:hypothetical protein [Ferrimicrobium sp.]
MSHGLRRWSAMLPTQRAPADEMPEGALRAEMLMLIIESRADRRTFS